MWVVKGRLVGIHRWWVEMEDEDVAVDVVAVGEVKVGEVGAGRT